MRNITHAVSGAAAYAALGSYAWHQPTPLLATGTAIALGAATLPDLDAAAGEYVLHPPVTGALTLALLSAGFSASTRRTAGT